MAGHPNIDIHYFNGEVKFNDVLLIITHPTVGMVSSIVGNYLIDHLDLKLVGAFLSDSFYPTAVVHKGLPLPPVRIYSGEYKDDPDTVFDQIVVIASDLPLDREVMFPLADRLIEWAQFNHTRALVTVEGINRENADLMGRNIKVSHVSTTQSGHEFLAEMGTVHLENGMVGGLSGILLSKGYIQQFPVISLLSDAHQQFPDSRSAVAVLSVLNKLVPKIDIDFEPLLQEAEMVEAQIRKSLMGIKQDVKGQGPSVPQGMYI
ncbi:MAG: proteasome assembly chaperone family protein [Candidatus Kariarchaeaceae archaeon]|jgi:uncharacterized protein